MSCATVTPRSTEPALPDQRCRAGRAAMLLLCLRILAVASVALYLIPTGTHLFELPAKMTLAPDEYMVTQGIYRGWSLFGIVVFAALLLVLLHSVLRRARR